MGNALGNSQGLIEGTQAVRGDGDSGETGPEFRQVVAWGLLFAQLTVLVVKSGWKADFMAWRMVVPTAKPVMEMTVEEGEHRVAMFF